MTLPNSFTFLAANGQYLNWTLTDPLTGDAINGATITATLYAGRDRDDPDTTPGTPVSGFTNVSLAFISAPYTSEFTGTLANLYQGTITSAFDPEPGGNYVLVVDATAPSYQPQHWESPAVVRPRGS